jgi:hypothetical protein
VALNIVRRPNTTPIHELERYMRCKHCSRESGRPFKRSHPVVPRATKISAFNPPSTWWPGGADPQQPLFARVFQLATSFCVDRLSSKTSRAFQVPRGVD